MNTQALTVRPDKMEVTGWRDDPVTQVSVMLQAAIEKGVTPENVSVAKDLMALLKDMQAQQVEREFDDAFALLQSDMQHVRAKKVVEGGMVAYKYATYEEIMEQVQPLLTKYQFAVSFDESMEENKVTSFITLSRKGHKRKHSYTCRVGQGRKGMSEPQIDGAAATTSKRNALCGMLNIVINHSDDKRNLGGPITAAQATSLRERVLATGSDEKKFLKWAGAANYELIKNESYAELDAELRKRESTT